MTSTEPALSVRSLEHRDLPAALAIQSAAYRPFLVEPEAAFASRLDLPSSYCLAATQDGALVAYLLAHAWAAEAPPPVGTVLSAPPAAGEVLFIHDLAVAPAARGTGIGRRLVMRAMEQAARDGLSTTELIAVEGAANYWRGLGFVESETSPELTSKVSAYGPDARWMTREI